MKSLKKWIAIVLAAHLANFAVLSTGHAAMISTDAVERTQEATAVSSLTPKEELTRSLMREDVQAELARMGVSADDAQARIAALTDDEAAQLNQQIQQAPAGGIIGVIVFVFLVLLITDILGLTKVFPFTRSVR